MPTNLNIFGKYTHYFWKDNDFRLFLFYDSLYIHFSAIEDIQSFLQRTDALALEVIDTVSYLEILTFYLYNSCYNCIKLASERLMAILYRNWVAAFGVGRDVDAEGYDVASVDGLFVDNFAWFVVNAYQVGFGKWGEIDT